MKIKKMFFDKDFYEMSNIKAYQSETTTLLKTLLRFVHRVVCLQKDHFWFWLVAAMLV